MSQHCPKNFSPSLHFVSMNEPLAAERPRGTNQQSGEQMTYWDKTKKIQIWWLCFTCPSASFALQFGDFVPCDG